MTDPIQPRDQALPIDDPQPTTQRSTPEAMRAQASQASADSVLDALFSRVRTRLPVIRGAGSAEPASTAHARPKMLTVQADHPLEVQVGGVQARLESFRQSFAGPYRIDGQVVKVPAQFHMGNGANDHERGILEARVKQHDPTRSAAYRAYWKARLDEHQALHDEVDAAIAKAHVSSEAASLARLGRATPEQLRQVVQALIDAGKVPAGSPSTVGKRVRDMMWKYGVGLDCAGYARQAFLSLHGATGARFGFKAAGDENLVGLGHNRHFERIDPTNVRAGDLCVLNPRPEDTVGHTVIVYSHQIAGESQKQAILDRYKGTSFGILQPDPVHIYQVDSSWGAGEGKQYGGVKRELWVYNESRAEWGYYQPAEPAGFVITSAGPYDHPLSGFYRVKEPQ